MNLLWGDYGKIMNNNLIKDLLNNMIIKLINKMISNRKSKNNM